jgi:hypothetical protein
MRYRPWFQEMMTDNNGNNIDDVIDALKGERMEAEKQVAKYSGLIEGDDKPSKTLVNKLTEWEAKADQLKERISIAEGKRSELASPEIDEEFFSGLESRMKDNDYRLKVREVLRSMISKITLHVHGVKYPRYVVERNNGNRWTVLFHNATRKNLAFQIFKGDVSKPDEGIIVFDSAALDLAA